MTLHDLLEAVRKHVVLMLLPVVVLVGGVGYLSVSATPQYRAQAAVFVSIAAGERPSDLNQGASFTQAQMLSYARLASLPVVLDGVIADLGLDESARSLAGRVSASTSQDVTILDVSATSSDPEEAARLANAVIAELATVIEDLSPDTGTGASAVRATIVDEAEAPSAPFAPSTRRNVMAAALAGAVLGVLAAWLRETLDTRVRRPRDVEQASGLPVLGVLRPVRKGSPELVTPLGITGPSAEDFRRVRANLQMIGRVGRPKVFVVASALPGEGKTYASVRIAWSFAAAGDRVLLVDADLRRPAVASRLGLEGAVGLTEVLVGRAHVDDVVQHVAPELDVLASGAVPPNPSELLSSNEFETLIADAGRRYDVVIIDAPPVLPVADAVVLARQVVGLIAVVDASRARRAHLARLVDAVRLGGGRVVGVVLNRARIGVEAAYGYVPTAAVSAAAARPTPSRARRAVGPEHIVVSRPADGPSPALPDAAVSGPAAPSPEEVDEPSIETVRIVLPPVRVHRREELAAPARDDEPDRAGPPVSSSSSDGGDRFLA